MPTAPHRRVRDRDIRTALMARVEEEHRGDPNTMVVPEMGLDAGSVRLDLAVINGTLHGYEIKSAADTLTRLPAQSVAYSRACDQVTIVTSPNHLESVREMVPSWWGILTAVERAGGVCLKEERLGTHNPTVDAYAVAQLLWRDEALELLEEEGLANGLRSKPRKQLWQAIAKQLPLDVLSEYVRSTIRRRQGWRPDSLPG